MSFDHKRVQTASSYVEENVLALLLRWEPAHQLTLGQAKDPAFQIREIAYDEMFRKIRDQYINEGTPL